MSYLQAWEVFIAVAEEKSFTAAAKKLALSQPTISFHIDGLEKKMGCSLFVRTRRGVELTLYGKALYADTGCVKDILARAESKVRELRLGASGHITIGAGTIPGEYLLPSVLADFLSRHSGVTVSLISADSQSVFRLWQDGKIPACVIGFLPQGVEDVHKIWSDEIIPVASPRMDCSRQLNSPLSLCRYPLIFRHDGSASMSSVWQALKAAGISADDCHVVLRVTGNEALKNAVKAGAGVGFISKLAVENELAEGALVQIQVEGLCIQRDFYALFDQALEMPAAAALREFLLSQIENPER